jgi:hypothetical protein
VSPSASRGGAQGNTGKAMVLSEMQQPPESGLKKAFPESVSPQFLF